MHGLIFSDVPLEFKTIEVVQDKGQMAEWKYWKYGHVFVGNYVNQQTVNYMAKYITKIDNDHKGFIGNILASPGIGRGFIDRMINPGQYKYRPRQTKDYYSLPNGAKVKLPKYYKNKFLNEEERELVWREFMDTGKDTISGTTYLKDTPVQILNNVTEKAKEINKFLDYGDDTKEWRKSRITLQKGCYNNNTGRKQKEDGRGFITQ